MVLCFTPMPKASGRGIESDPRAAINFHWKDIAQGRCGRKGWWRKSVMRKPMRISPPGPRTARSAPGASPQSRAMEGRFVFEKRLAEYGVKYALTKVPRPPYWTGWRITPLRIEFWRDRPFRLHDRLVYLRDDAHASWRTERLFP